MKTAVVTGASGGIGTAVCRALVDDGYRVVGLDLVTPADEAAPWIHRHVDLAEPGAAGAAVDDLSADCRVVVHCAADQPLLRVAEGSWPQWQRAFQVNVLSLEEIVTRTLPGLRQHGDGVVVAIGSIHGATTSGRMAPYSCSKAALDAWVRAAAIDLSPDVCAISVALGAVDTPKLAQGLARWDDPVAARRALEARIPIGAIMTANEVADVVLTLLRPGARHLTGSRVSMDGGVSARLASE